MNDARPVLGVGWDVGGWCGKKQAVAVATWCDGRPAWCGDTKPPFCIDQLEKDGGSLKALIKLAWPERPEDVLEHYQVVVAIDAPLSFPRAFVDFLDGKPVERPSAKEFINNRLAFRECDRAMKGLGKMPLSASFDKLGNPATVAMFYARKWAKNGEAVILPFDEEVRKNAATIIEVYPALAKVPKTNTCIATFARWLSDIKPGTHEADACICALMALAFQSRHPECLPKLVGPDEFPAIREEGWIYHPAGPKVRPS